VPKRVILSGHSAGDSVFGHAPHHAGGGDVHLQFADFRRLAQAMPKAAAAVEHIQFAGCFTYRQFSMPEKRAQWQAAFPNVRSMMGYASKSPPAPIAHLNAWRERTANDAAGEAKDVRQLPGGVGVWDTSAGYRGNVEQLADLRAACTHADAGIPALVSGKRPLSGPSDAAADGPYQLYRKLEGRPDATVEERARAHAMGDHFLAIRFHQNFVAQFQRNGAKQLSDGCTALGTAVPDFASMSRAKAFAEASALLAKCQAQTPPRSTEDAAKLRAMEPVLQRIITLRESA
jgi:hypothetical protein